MVSGIKPWLFSAALLAGSLAWAQQPAASNQPVGVVSHVKVLSDKIEDVSSMEAWKNSFIKEGMTDQEKALAVWTTAVKFRQQDNPPREWLQSSGTVQDPIKTYNVYGYGMCSCVSSNVEAMARYVGLEARGRAINHHSVPEVKWDGKWHLLDASLLCYFRNPDGSIASVDEIMADVAQWQKKSGVDLQDNAKLVAMSRSEAFRTNGPEMFKKSEFFGARGWCPAKTHGWYAVVSCYDGTHKGFYEYGYSQGYEVNVQLRPGEKLVRNWSNKGLYVNSPENKNPPGSMDTPVGKGDLVYAPQYGDIAPGRLGNGVREYDVPLADGTFRTGALVAENLATSKEAGGGPAAQVKDGNKDATLIIRMPSSYLFLTGTLDLNPVIGEGGSINLSISDNNGLDWKEVTSITAPGPQQIDLKPFVFRRYDYQAKLVMHGKGTGLEALKFSHDVQQSQRALPALAKGKNTISFSAGQQEGTITIEGSVVDNGGKNLQISDFHPTLANLERGQGKGPLAVQGKQGQVTFPVRTPGDLVRLRFGSHYRALGEKDGWDYQVSFDGGKTFQTVDRAGGPYPGMSKYVTFDKIPAGTREALVRFAGTQEKEAMLYDLRIDADYKEPFGGFAPVKVSYLWEEDGQEKRHEFVAKEPTASYEINCENKPLMKSVTVELVK